MTPEQLKASILQYAIQGKLVEQRAEEGTGEELYQQIQAEKERLIKEGKIKKGKPLAEITDDEIPFDIPESWKWVYVGAIFAHNTGKAMNSSAKNVDKSGLIRPFITTSNVYWNTFDFSAVKEMFFSDDEVDRCTVTKGDILMCEGGAYFGRTAIWNYDYDICFQNHIHRLRPYREIDLMFFYYIFFFYKNMNMMKAKGTAMPGLSSITLHQMIIPLPPLAEQKRIVAKIEELLPLVDRYAASYEKLEQFNAKFPEDMKKSILQYAIQGKLVEQRPEEGTGEELYQQIQAEKQRLIKEGKIKKEKPFAGITDDEIPFDIPESWKWVRLGTVAIKLTDGSHNPPPNSGTGYPVISAKNVKNGLITFENVERFTDETGFAKENPRTNIIAGDIIMGIIGGSIGNVAVYTHDVKVIAQRSIAIIKTLALTDYVVILLKSPLVQNRLRASTAGSAQGGVYLGTLNNLVIPLPPLAEQKRIVAKVEELLPYCDRLKNNDYAKS